MEYNWEWKRDLNLRFLIVCDQKMDSLKIKNHAE